MNDDTLQRMHIGPAKDPGQNRQPNLTREPIKRTVSQVTNRKPPSGAKGINNGRKNPYC